MIYTSNKNRHNFWSKWATCIAFALPVGLNFGDLGGKPIDFIPSDLWLFLLLFGFFIKASFHSKNHANISKSALRLTFLPIFYFIIIALIAEIFSSHSGGNIISAARFAKQFLFILAGWLIFRDFGFGIIRPLLFTFAAIQILMFGSDVFLGSFPLGCGKESRWGGCIFQIDVYGFPNSSASYGVAITAILISAAKDGLLKKSFLGLVVFIGLILAVFSLSRAAWIYFLWVLVMAWIFLLNWKSKVMSLALIFGGIFILMVMVGNLESDALSGVLLKIERSLSHDPTSGRLDIWDKTVALILERPFFGYGFEYFSNYVEGYDTAHNQYLEILFKSGVVGLFLYIGIISMLWKSLSAKNFPGSASVLMFLKWGVLAGILVNGLFHPILSYSVVANLLMVSIGFVLSAAKTLKFTNK